MNTRNIAGERMSKVVTDLVPKFESIRIGSKSVLRNVKGAPYEDGKTPNILMGTKLPSM